ncbi:MAG: peptide-methionine (S)-S-oxide reductase MsrA [Verrucomicrobiota bacterium]|jgi:peptide-methionine (S)-S-oxide reductase
MNRRHFLPLLAALPALAPTMNAADSPPPKAPPKDAAKPASDPKAATEKIVIGGGCFWCTEAVLQRVNGVKKVVSGYSGGHVPNPTYEQICTKTTGHAEVIQVEFDPAKVTLATVLEVFFAAHDPTTLNRQGADAGPQYRSCIFYANDAQKQAAETAKKVAQPAWKDPIVTEIAALKNFYAAEDYHQNYFNLNATRNGYCSVVIVPKLRKLIKEGKIREN